MRTLMQRKKRSLQCLPPWRMELENGAGKFSSRIGPTLTNSGSRKAEKVLEKAKIEKALFRYNFQGAYLKSHTTPHFVDLNHVRSHGAPQLLWTLIIFRSHTHRRKVCDLLIEYALYPCGVLGGCASLCARHPCQRALCTFHFQEENKHDHLSSKRFASSWPCIFLQDNSSFSHCRFSCIQRHPLEGKRSLCTPIPVMAFANSR